MLFYKNYYPFVFLLLTKLSPMLVISTLWLLSTCWSGVVYGVVAIGLAGSRCTCHFTCYPPYSIPVFSTVVASS